MHLSYQLWIIIERMHLANSITVSSCTMWKWLKDWCDQLDHFCGCYDLICLCYYNKLCLPVIHSYNVLYNYYYMAKLKITFQTSAWNHSQAINNFFPSTSDKTNITQSILVIYYAFLNTCQNTCFERIKKYVKDSSKKQTILYE